MGKKIKELNYNKIFNPINFLDKINGKKDLNVTPKKIELIDIKNDEFFNFHLRKMSIFQFSLSFAVI